MEEILFGAFLLKDHRKGCILIGFQSGTNQSEHACDPRKTVNFSNFQKMTSSPDNSPKKDTFQETFPLSPAFLLQF
jgi:hypothetical protein